MKIIKTLLLVFGCLFIIAGVLLLIYNEVSGKGVFAAGDQACETADKESDKLEQLVRQHDLASVTGDRIRLEFESKIQTERTERWLRNCSEERSWALYRTISFSGLMIAGLILAAGSAAFSIFNGRIILTKPMQMP